MPSNNNFLHTDRCGITVVGTATVRTFPDSASISAAVSRSAAEAKPALVSARESAEQVQAFLKGRGIRNYSAGRISLTQSYQPVEGDARKMALTYRGRIGFTIKLAELDQVDELVSGLIEAGANELLAIGYQSSVIAEARNDARRQAVAAARDKAHLFCQELGVTAGRVLGINEVMVAPTPKPAAAPAAGPSTTDPTELSVGSTVEVTFEIVRED